MATFKQNVVRYNYSFFKNVVKNYSLLQNCSLQSSELQLLRYYPSLLKGTINYGLLYSENASPDCVGFSDADWAGDLNDRKSTSGYTFQMSDATVSWRSKKQTCVALSTAEAECIGLSAATQEAL